MKSVSVVVFVALAIGSSPAAAQTTPEAFLKATIIQLFRGQYDREWSTLHPAQQKIVPLKLFVRCASAGFHGTLRDAKVLDSYDAVDRSIPGTKLRAKSKAVTFRIRYYVGGVSRTDVDTFRTTMVRGAWRWLLETGPVSAYKQGRCA